MTPGPDLAALARGGRTNFAGFVLRLIARIPFLVIGARFYGPEALGIFAYATLVAEFAAAACVLGLKRGMAAEMAARRDDQAAALLDGLVAALLAALAVAGLLAAFPALMTPAGQPPVTRWLALTVPLIVLADVTLAGLAFRHRIGAQVRARSVVEPWTLSLAAGVLAFTALATGEGLILAYIVSLVAAAIASAVPAIQLFGWPPRWRPRPRVWLGIARRNLPLAGAELVDWTVRRLDLFLLARLAGTEVVGIYYVAQQVATLAGKIRITFDPILAPLLTTALKDCRPEAAAAHIRQVGFWVLALQIPVVLALGLAGEGVLGLFGPAFAAGALILALLLTAELAAASSGVNEAALVYASPRTNLAIALGSVAVQAALTLWWVPMFGGAGAAAGLLAALTLAAAARQLRLRGCLGHPIGFWRWPLFAAGAAAFAAGYLLRALPEAWHMAIGIPAVLFIFGALVWRLGFRTSDRALFRRG